MSLAPGTRLGSYDVTAQIGAGGMGEVYRARDSKLDRDVALKVLPAALAQDPERLARFEREARTLAQLNHPNIAAIYGVEDSTATKALVMELVDGPTLADRRSLHGGGHRHHARLHGQPATADVHDAHADAPTRMGYDVSPDGQTFVMTDTGEDDRVAGQVMLLQNWFEELKRLVP